MREWFEVICRRCTYKIEPFTKRLDNVGRADPEYLCWSGKNGEERENKKSYVPEGICSGCTEIQQPPYRPDRKQGRRF